MNLELNIGIKVQPFSVVSELQSPKKNIIKISIRHGKVSDT